MTSSVPLPQITKTDYLHYLECPLYAWLSKNRKNLVEKQEALFMINGNKVEDLARSLFPKGTEVKFDRKRNTSDLSGASDDEKLFSSC